MLVFPNYAFLNKFRGCTGTKLVEKLIVLAMFKDVFSEEGHIEYTKRKRINCVESYHKINCVNYIKTIF